jgi:hypothetical protein
MSRARLEATRSSPHRHGAARGLHGHQRPSGSPGQGRRGRVIATPPIPIASPAAVARRAGAVGIPAIVFDHVSFAFDENVVLRDVSFTVPEGSHDDPAGSERQRQERAAQAHPRPASGPTQGRSTSRAAHRHPAGARAGARARRHRHAVPGGRTLRFAHRRRQRRLQAVRRDGHALGPGAQSSARRCWDSSASRTTSTGCPRSCPAASGGAWRSRAPWPPSPA